MDRFVEKLISEIEELANHDGNPYLDSADVLEIIKQLAEEYNNGWIPCSSGNLPEVGVKVIVTDSEGEVHPDMWYGYAEVNDSEPCFNRWDDEMYWCFRPEVVAWQPLPAPYVQK